MDEEGVRKESMVDDRMDVEVLVAVRFRVCFVPPGDRPGMKIWQLRRMREPSGWRLIAELNWISATVLLRCSARGCEYMERGVRVTETQAFDGVLFKHDSIG